MKHLDLFSGIGGFALAARWVGWETVGFCEIDHYCNAVLKKHWPNVQNYWDITEPNNTARFVELDVDIITAGFPCQPFSAAGKQRGAADDRNLWPELIRVIEAVQPAWVVGENVPGFAKMGLDAMSLKLESLGYATQSLLVPAVGVGAPHKRERLWIIAHSKRNEQPREKPRGRKAGRMGRKQQPVPWDRSWEDAVAHARRMDDGISGRMVTNRTDAIRNAIVPQVAEVIFQAINSVVGELKSD